MRPEGGKIGDGQTQCFAKLDKLSYDNYKYYDGEVEVDSDDSDYSTDSSAGEEDVDVQIVKQKTKWKCKTSVKFYTDESASTQVAELKVKAKGKAKQKDTLVRTEMEDGSVEESHEFEQKTKVKKFFYKLEMADGTEVPVTLDGNWNKVRSDSLNHCRSSPINPCVGRRAAAVELDLLPSRCRKIRGGSDGENRSGRAPDAVVVNRLRSGAAAVARRREKQLQPPFLRRQLDDKPGGRLAPDAPAALFVPAARRTFVPELEQI